MEHKQLDEQNLLFTNNHLAFYFWHTFQIWQVRSYDPQSIPFIRFISYVIYIQILKFTTLFLLKSLSYVLFTIIYSYSCYRIYPRSNVADSNYDRTTELPFFLFKHVYVLIMNSVLISNNRILCTVTLSLREIVELGRQSLPTHRSGARRQNLGASEADSWC